MGKVNTDKDRQCGIGCCKPRFLQVCTNIAAFTAAYCPPALITSALVMYIPSQVTTLEKYYGFSSSQSGFILSCNDIGFLLTTLVASFLARKVHIPRALSWSTMLYGLAAFVSALAYFILPGRKLVPALPRDQNGTMDTSNDSLSIRASQMCTHEPLSNINVTECGAGMTDRIGAPTAYTTTALAIVGIGMILQGIGKAPRQPYIVTYIDGNVEKQKTSCYLGIITGVAIFGPALGFGLGAVFSNIYVTMETVPINIRDPRWVGAWWLGFIVFGGIAVIVALPLCCFPRQLEQKNETTDQYVKSKTIKEASTEFTKSLRRILTNPLYMLNLIGSCITLFLVGGFLSFLPKYLETQYSLPTWYANTLMGGLAVTSASLGSMTGGAMVRYLKMSPYSCLRFIFFVSAGTSISPIIAMFIGCSTPNIVGFNTQRMDSSNVSTEACAASCHCGDVDYFPVCGSDGNSYFSACHAGCTETTNGVYMNCMCVSGTNGTATFGLCPSNCGMLWPFMALNFINAFVATMCILPRIIFQIRSVSEKDKAMAVGLSTFLQTLIGWMPGPVIAGMIVDTCCEAWGTSCFGKGACRLYDNDKFRFRRYIVECGAQVAIVTINLITLLLARKKTDWSTDNPISDNDVCPEKDELMGLKCKTSNVNSNDPIVKKKLLV